MTQQLLPLENVQALLRKISINVLNKDAEQTLFTLPFEGVTLSREQLNAYMGDYTFESWFNQRGDVWHPMPWIARLPKGEIVIEDEFESDGAEIIVSGGKELVFEAGDRDEDDDEEPAPPVRVTNIVLTPKPGGVTLLGFHLQVRPGLGKENLALQEHQFRHVTVTLGDTKLATSSKGKQQSLPLAPVSDQTGHQSPPPIESKGGDAIDAEMRARHPESSAEVMGADAQPDPYLEGIMQRQGADGHPDPDVNSPSTEAEAHSEGGGIPADDPATDLAKFEEGAAQRLKDFTSVSETGAIDGTTPKSRRRGRREDTAH